MKDHAQGARGCEPADHRAPLDQLEPAQFVRLGGQELDLGFTDQHDGERSDLNRVTERREADDPLACPKRRVGRKLFPGPALGVPAQKHPLGRSDRTDRARCHWHVRFLGGLGFHRFRGVAGDPRFGGIHPLVGRDRQGRQGLIRGRGRGLGRFGTSIRLSNHGLVGIVCPVGCHVFGRGDHLSAGGQAPGRPAEQDHQQDGGEDRTEPFQSRAPRWLRRGPGRNNRGRRLLRWLHHAARDRLASLDQPIHALPGLGRHLGFLTDQAENLVATGHLRQMNVRGQTTTLVLGDRLGRQFIVEVAGHQIRVGSIRPLVVRHGQSSASGHAMDALHKFVREGTFRHLLTDLTDLRRWQGVIEPGQQCSQGQAHRSVPSGAAFHNPLMPATSVSGLPSRDPSHFFRIRAFTVRRCPLCSHALNRTRPPLRPGGAAVHRPGREPPSPRRGSS